MGRINLWLPMALCVLGLATGARAQTTVPLFSSGVDSGGSVLSGGAHDPHFERVGFGPAVVIHSASLPSSWLPNSSTSKWIWADAFGETAGTLTFRTTFDLSGFDPSSASLVGKWSSDNESFITLNGAPTGNSLGSTGFGSLHSFSVSSGFVSGVNTLDFVVSNTGGPGGLRVDNLSFTANETSAVPEPASLPMLASVLLFLALIQVKANRRASAPRN